MYYNNNVLNPNPTYYWHCPTVTVHDIVEAFEKGLISRLEAKKALKIAFPTVFEAVTTQEKK